MLKKINRRINIGILLLSIGYIFCLWFFYKLWKVGWEPILLMWVISITSYAVGLEMLDVRKELKKLGGN